MAGTGGTGGEGGIGGMTGDDLTNAARALCMKADECYGPVPVEDCTTYYVDYFDGFSAGCQAAVISYFECISEQEGCNDFSACYDYGDAYYDACF